MAITLTLRQFTAHPDGRIEMVFNSSVSGTSGRIWPSMDALAQDMALIETEDQAFNYFLAYWTARDADLSNPAIMLDKNFLVDFSAPNPIRLQ